MMRGLRQKLGALWRDAKERALPPRLVRIVEGDALPARLPCRSIVVLREDGEDWSVAMRCPCGCGETIELMLLPEAKPRWTLVRNGKLRGSLSPSVWRQTGCRSHYWLTGGRVKWCK